MNAVIVNRAVTPRDSRSEVGGRRKAVKPMTVIRKQGRIMLLKKKLVFRCRWIEYVTSGKGSGQQLKERRTFVKESTRMF